MKKILWITLFFIFSLNASAEQKANIKILETPPFVMGDIYHGELTFWPKGEVSVDQVRGLAGHILPGGKWFVGKVDRARESENNEQALVADLILVPVAAGENNAGGVIKFGENHFALTITSSSVREVKPVSEKFLALDQRISLPKDFNWGIVGSATALLLLVGLGIFLWRRRKTSNKSSPSQNPIDWNEKIKKAKTRSDMEALYAGRTKWAGVIIPKDKEVIDFFELMYRHQYKKEWSPEVKEQMSAALAKVKERVGDQLS